MLKLPGTLLHGGQALITPIAKCFSCNSERKSFRNLPDFRLKKNKTKTWELPRSLPFYLEVPPFVFNSLPPIFFLARLFWVFGVSSEARFAI